MIIHVLCSEEHDREVGEVNVAGRWVRWPRYIALVGLPQQSGLLSREFCSGHLTIHHNLKHLLPSANLGGHHAQVSYFERLPICSVRSMKCCSGVIVQQLLRLVHLPSSFWRSLGPGMPSKQSGSEARQGRGSRCRLVPQQACQGNHS